MATDEVPLNQEELDALLGGLGEKPAAEEAAPRTVAPLAGKPGKVKTYDFRRPDRFSKDHIRTLEFVHDSFARLVQASLSTYLRSLVDLKVTSVKQMTYEEFIQTLSHPTNINIFTMEPLKGNAVLEVNVEMMFTMIDRVLGGPGNVITKVRELTAIEQPVVERIIVRALDNLREAWQKVTPIVPKLESMESNPHFVQIASPSEIVALITLEVKIKEQTGLMHLCMPYVLLEPIVPNLSAREMISSGQKAGPTAESNINLKRGLGDTLLGLTAVLGRARLSVQEVLGLKRGDIVRLNRSVHADLTLEVEGREKFFGRGGVTDSKKKGFMISKVVTPPEDFF